MKLRDRPIAVWAFPLVMLALALLVLSGDWGGIASGLRGTLFDSYARQAPRPWREVRDHPVRVLTADGPSFSRFGPWPWPRAVLARLIGELKDQGASIVVLALPLAKPDPASPRNLLALVPEGAGYDAARDALLAMPAPDTALAAALARVTSVTGFTLGTAAAPVLAVKATARFEGRRDPFGRTPAFTAAEPPLPVLARASAGLGALNLEPGMVRRMPLLFRLDGKAVPGLDAEVLRLAEHETDITVASDDGHAGLFGGAPGIAAIETAKGALPTAPDGAIWLYYSGPDRRREVSAAALDSGTLAQGALKNAIVYLGAPGDLVATPQGARPAAEVHAEAMEDLLLGTVLRRPAAAAQAELLCLALMGVIAVFLFARAGTLWTALFVGVSIVLVNYVSWRLYLGGRVLFDSLGLSLGLASVLAAALAARGLEIAATRLRLKQAFADMLPTSAIDRIAKKPALLKLDGENRTVTMMACGVRGFAELAASFRDDPAAFTRLMQRVHEPLMDAAMAHGGAVDKLTTEGFVAFWNAPLDDPEHAIHACEAAGAMMEAIARTNETVTHERRLDGIAFPPIEIGIGISTGPAIAGGFRAHGRTAYSVNGDCAVLAGRIQALSAQYGPAVIASEDTRKAAERGFAFLEVDYIAAGVGEDPVKLYAMLGNPVMRASPKFRALATFHDHIFESMRTRQWQKARALIEQCRKLSGASQKLYDLHLARIAYFEDNPPPADWDGAFRPILH